MLPPPEVTKIYCEFNIHKGYSVLKKNQQERLAVSKTMNTDNKQLENNCLENNAIAGLWWPMPLIPREAEAG